MKRPKISFSSVLTILMVLFLAAFVFSGRVKNWVYRSSMSLGFFKPHIPDAKPAASLAPAPALMVQNIAGKVIDLQQQKGKVVFINFWATWCGPCLSELPSVNHLYEKVKADTNIVFLSVDVDNTLGKSAQFLREKGYLFPVYGGKLDGLPKQVYSGSIPTTLVVDKKGFIVYNHVDMANYNDDKFVQYILGLSKQ
jgi:thiol-disulfide isomerase/thioredoxin